MNAALSKAWGLKFDGIDGESLDRVNGGKGLGEGENDLRIQTKGPKWEIKLTIVIKF